jgi:transposase-like protein
VGSASLSYKGHRYPAEIISHCVWLYFRFPLSFREVEELMFERGIIVSYDHPPLVREVRAAVRRIAAPPPATAW